MFEPQIKYLSKYEREVKMAYNSIIVFTTEAMIIYIRQ